jgi:hypothetical protein
MKPTFDNTQAHLEGWELALDSSGKHYLWHAAPDRCSNLPGFNEALKYDELEQLAIDHVKERAAAGSPYHIQALAIFQLT